jgi:hypothetical protein
MRYPLLCAGAVVAAGHWVWAFAADLRWRAMAL